MLLVNIHLGENLWKKQNAVQKTEYFSELWKRQQDK